jgi:hypothetical protein
MGALSLFYNVSTYGGLFLNIKKKFIKNPFKSKDRRGEFELALGIVGKPSLSRI